MNLLHTGCCQLCNPKPPFSPQSHPQSGRTLFLCFLEIRKGSKGSICNQTPSRIYSSLRSKIQRWTQGPATVSSGNACLGHHALNHVCRGAVAVGLEDKIPEEQNSSSKRLFPFKWTPLGEPMKNCHLSKI